MSGQAHYSSNDARGRWLLVYAGLPVCRPLPVLKTACYAGGWSKSGRSTGFVELTQYVWPVRDGTGRLSSFMTRHTAHSDVKRRAELRKDAQRNTIVAKGNDWEHLAGGRPHVSTGFVVPSAGRSETGGGMNGPSSVHVCYRQRRLWRSSMDCICWRGPPDDCIQRSREDPGA